MTGWLHEQRLDAVRNAIRDRGARTILDLGCGDGDLLVWVIHKGIDRAVGFDRCARSLT